MVMVYLLIVILRVEVDYVNVIMLKKLWWFLVINDWINYNYK